MCASILWHSRKVRQGSSTLSYTPLLLPGHTRTHHMIQVSFNVEVRIERMGPCLRDSVPPKPPLPFWPAAVRYLRYLRWCEELSAFFSSVVYDFSMPRFSLPCPHPPSSDSALSHTHHSHQVQIRQLHVKDLTALSTFKYKGRACFRPSAKNLPSTSFPTTTSYNFHP